MINYEKRDSHEIGYQAGLEEGIKGVINTCKSFNSTREQAKSALINQFHLTEEKANEYIHLYW